VNLVKLVVDSVKLASLERFGEFDESKKFKRKSPLVVRICEENSFGIRI